ncbi:hypothetical protein [Rhodanobacter thiooxydans]|uniref:hypothetical protein n=1 Tax=Rhodanobacter thiooxydans TaxID=416169 RepID=UPI000B018C68|nr:hypothetical protein [Rhodanobacter thiooxydans]MCW0202853.1 hypothetical protein [Rhodanobacter thiooxydans]
MSAAELIGRLEGVIKTGKGWRALPFARRQVRFTGDRRGREQRAIGALLRRLSGA